MNFHQPPRKSSPSERLAAARIVIAASRREMATTTISSPAGAVAITLREMASIFARPVIWLKRAAMFLRSRETNVSRLQAKRNARGGRNFGLGARSEW